MAAILLVIVILIFGLGGYILMGIVDEFIGKNIRNRGRIYGKTTGYVADKNKKSAW